MKLVLPYCFGGLLLFSYTPAMPQGGGYAIAADLPTIVQRGKLIVGVKDNTPPLGYVNSQGELVGLEIEIAKRLAQEILGSETAIIWKPLANQNRISALSNDDVDIVVARVANTPARSRLADFSAPYYLDGTAFITSDSTIAKAEDLAGKKVAVLKGAITISELKNRLPSAQLVEAESYLEARELLRSHQVIAVAADASILAGWIQAEPQYRLLPNRISTAALCIMMPKGLQYQGLRDRVNRAIASWRQQGWLRQRAIYWKLPL
ncbi:ABC transporter substrate-binding protein [Merismopedia glauca CCAP 1448/3]|uniref:ABC transporter substrate-binding protein n=1 Tax=Merismopedia glauca CCAP 1448/3 TaxID=1296344 RepID=A0A2T1C1D0_9CYAN|nr:ABC transporter substrate-binding protein [Merismopedia glauca CCAP 1448/3]